MGEKLYERIEFRPPGLPGAIWALQDFSYCPSRFHCIQLREGKVADQRGRDTQETAHYVQQSVTLLRGDFRLIQCLRAVPQDLAQRSVDRPSARSVDVIEVPPLGALQQPVELLGAGVASRVAKSLLPGHHDASLDL